MLVADPGCRTSQRRGIPSLARMALALAATAACLASRSPAVLGGLLAAAGTLAAVCGLATSWLRLLRGLAPMAAVLAAATMASSGWHEALASSLRLVALVTVFFLLFRSTAPEELAASLVRLAVPREAAFILCGAAQFVPVLRRRIRCVIDAQRARGIPVGFHPAGWRHLAALLVPLLVQSLELANDLAAAMETRGYRRSARQKERVR